MLFAQTRRRLTLLYLGLFSLVIGLFSLVFLLAIAVALQPDFDIAPELTNEQVAQLAYHSAIERIGIALVVADIAVLGIVGVVAWVLAARTLQPIREAHERQSRFVADASHEMRSPLTAIRTTTESALIPGTSSIDRENALRQIAVASERLGRLSMDLLLLAQSDDASLAPHREAFDLSVNVSEALQLRTADVKTSRIHVSLTPDLSVSGDPDEVARILDNLVDNALRYGGPRVVVRVSTRATDREAILEVADTGPGIAEADRERIFEPFHRLRADADAPSGTGLGLSIAASLARRNRGRLTLESQPGRGSVFRLALPRFR